MNIEDYRLQIDDVDSELLRNIAKRLELAEGLGQFKRDNGIPIYHPEREEEVIADRIDQGSALGIPEEITRSIFRILIDKSREIQEKDEGNS